MSEVDPGRLAAGGETRHVVIVGGGFAGLYCAKALARTPVRVTLLDRRNHHVFQPLLYQVATASLSPGDIAQPIRHVLAPQRNARVWLANAESIDVSRRIVTLADGAELEYDALVVATGATHAYFGHDEWATRAPGLKTIEDAQVLRRRFLLAFEAAERESDPARRQQLVTFVIVGAGPTGVELAGAMAEIARRSIPRDFRTVDTGRARVLLVEGLDHVLPAFPPDLSEKARRQLEELGVEVRTSTRVTDVRERAVVLDERETVPTGNVFWAAGVSASPLGAALAAAAGAELDRAGRVKVKDDLSVPGHPEIFVAGDLAHVEQDGQPVPGVAPAAIQMGRHVADCLRRDADGRPRRPFRYVDKGLLATIGRAAAVASLGPVKLSGLPAWLTWAFVHVLYLIGFRNRLLVMVQWALAWLTWQRGVRLITGEDAAARDGGPR